jgi:hypothetical protein
MLERILVRSGLLPRPRVLWKAAVDGASKPLRKDVRQLASRLEALELELAEASKRAQRADRLATQLRLTAALDDRDRARWPDLPCLLDEPRITAHIRQAIAASPLLTDPYEHAVVENLLPDDVYRLLLAVSVGPNSMGNRMSRLIGSRS